MRIGVAVGIAAMVACGGGTTSNATDGGGAGGSGGAGGGSGGATLCDQGCKKLGFEQCPVAYDVAECTTECVGAYADDPQCAAQFDTYAQCAIVKASVGCDADGQAYFADVESVCNAQITALAQCLGSSG
jgi:hypothetical protein